MIVLPALAFAAILGAQNAPRCSLRRIDACESANDLSSAAGFAQALRGFTGGAATDLLGEREPLANALLDLIIGPPDDPVRLGNGDLLLTGCQVHQCYRGGAVVVSPAGSIVAVAMLAPRWSVMREGKPTAFTDADGLLLSDGRPKPAAHWTLDIYVRRASPDAPAWNGRIAAWAKQQFADSNLAYAAYQSGAELTGRVWLISPGSRKPKLLRTAHLG